MTAGEANGGEMQYALGTATEATEAYTTSIPTATNVGTYYVWYKVFGDEKHNDSEPASVPATIKEAPKDSDSSSGAVNGRGGSVTTEQLKDNNVNTVNQSGSAAEKEGTAVGDVIDQLEVEEKKINWLDKAVATGGASLAVTGEGESGAAAAVQGTKGEVLAAILTPQEMVDAITGNDQVEVTLEVKDTGTPSTDVQAAVEGVKNEGEQVHYLDADIFLKKMGVPREHVTKLAKKISITFSIPVSLRGEGRAYRLIRTHDSGSGLETAILLDEDSDADTFTFATDKLCTLGLAYTTASATPTYAPSYSDSGSSYVASSDSGSGGGGGSSGGSSYLTAGKHAGRGHYIKTGKRTVTYVEPSIKAKRAKKARKAVVPAKVKIGKKTYKVTSIDGYAFIGSDQLREVKIGKNVKKISPYAFAGCKKLKAIKVRSRLLTKKKIKGCLKGSSVDTVIVLKKASDKYPAYRKIFTPKVTGAPGKLSVTKKK